MDGTVDEAVKKIGTDNGTPEGMKGALMAHQVVGVAWMTGMEEGKAGCRGGILADDMGLGKVSSGVIFFFFSPLGYDAIISQFTKSLSIRRPFKLSL